MVMLLTQYIDNACKYSIFGSTITIRAVKSRAEIVFSVRSFGQVIPINDRERIFDAIIVPPPTPIAPRAPESAFQSPSASRSSMVVQFGSPAMIRRDNVFAAIPATARKRVS